MTFYRIFFIIAGLTICTAYPEQGAAHGIRKISSNSSFFDALGQNLLAVVKVSSPHCGPCRQYAPTFEKAAAAHQNIAFFEIVLDSLASRELAKTLGVSSIPATIFFVRGTRVFGKVGALSPYQLEKAIKEAFPELF